MTRLADWPRSPYLNEELREWIRLHLAALGVDDLAMYALASPRADDERRVLVATEVGLLDGWYAPRGSTARFSLSTRLHPWPTVHGVDLRGETYRLWAHEHQSRWRLRLAHPPFDALAEGPELGNALAEFAAACAVMAEPAGDRGSAEEDLPPAPPAAGRVGPRPAIRVEPEPEPRRHASEDDESQAEAEAQANAAEARERFEERLGLSRLGG